MATFPETSPAAIKRGKTDVFAGYFGPFYRQKVADFPTHLYTSTSEIPTLSYTWSPPRPCVHFWRHSDHSRQRQINGGALEPGIRDCIYGRYAGFSVIMKRDPGDSHLKAPGFLTAKIFKRYSTLAVSNDWKTGNLSRAFPPRWHAAAARQRSVRQETTMERAGTLLPPYLYHREVLPGNSVSLEPAGKWDGRSGTGDKDDKEGVVEYDLSSSDEDSEEQSLGNDNDEGDNDVGDIHESLVGEANFLLGTFSRFGKLFESATCCWGSKNDSK